MSKHYMRASLLIANAIRGETFIFLSVIRLT